MNRWDATLASGDTYPVDCHFTGSTTERSPYRAEANVFLADPGRHFAAAPLRLPWAKQTGPRWGRTIRRPLFGAFLVLLVLLEMLSVELVIILLQNRNLCGVDGFRFFT